MAPGLSSVEIPCKIDTNRFVFYDEGMNNRKASLKWFLPLILLALAVPFSLQAQTSGNENRLKYAKELDQIAKKAVDSIKKMKLPTASAWEQKYKDSAKLYKAAVSLEKSGSKVRSPLKKITPGRPLQEYLLEGDDSSFFGAHYSESGSAWTLNAKTKRSRDENTRLANICAQILKADAASTVSAAIGGYAEIIAGIAGFYSGSPSEQGPRGGTVGDRESRLTEKIGTLYYLSALNGSGTTSADSALVTFQGYASKYAHLSDEDLSFEYDRLTTAVDRQIQDDLSLYRRRVESERNELDALGDIPVDSAAEEAKEAGIAAFERAEAALTEKKEREAAVALAEASLQFSRCRLLLAGQTAAELNASKSTSDPIPGADPAAIEALQRDLVLIRTLLTLGAGGTLNGFAQAVATVEEGSRLMHSGETAEAVRRFDAAEKNLTELIKQFRESGGNSALMGIPGDAGSGPITYSAVNGDLSARQQAFDGYLVRMAEAQEQGDYTKAAEYYRLAQDELTAIEAIKTAETRQNILLVKKSWNDLLGVTLKLNEGIRSERDRQGFMSSLKRNHEKAARAEKILGTATGYTDFVQAESLYRAALNELQELNSGILAALKTQLQNDRSALDSGSRPAEKQNPDRGGKSDGPYVLPF